MSVQAVPCSSLTHILVRLTFSGNEMDFSSVDAAIAENLESRGNIFSPNINLLMTEEYIDI